MKLPEKGSIGRSLQQARYELNEKTLEFLYRYCYSPEDQD